MAGENLTLTRQRLVFPDLRFETDAFLRTDATDVWALGDVLDEWRRPG